MQLRRSPMNKFKKTFSVRLFMNALIFCFVTTLVWGQEIGGTLPVPASSIGAPIVLPASWSEAFTATESSQSNNTNQNINGPVTPSVPVQSKAPAPFSTATITTQAVTSAATAVNPVTNQISRFSSTGVNVLPQFGNIVKSFPIEVPQGVNGIQPGLALVYASNYHRGFIGVGWTLPLTSIRRSTKKGTPTYDTNDTYEFNQAGSLRDLILDSTQNYYRAKIEKDFSKYELTNNIWTMTDRSGTKYIFGKTDLGRQFDENFSSNSETFQWFLEEVQDVLGNTMTIAYEKEDNEIYPSFIEYTSNVNVGLTAFARVEFVYGALAPSPTVRSYEPGFLVHTKRQLDKITVRGDGNILREYVLNYSDSVVTARKLLTTITQLGADGSSLVPPVTLSYYGDTKGFDVGSTQGIPLAAQFSALSATLGDVDFGVRVVDVNSDGYPDLVQNYRQSGVANNFNNVFINQKDLSWIYDPNWTLPQNSYTDFDEGVVNTALIGERLMDLDADLNPPPFFVNMDSGIRFADINGDSQIDMIESHKHQEQIFQTGGTYQLQKQEMNFAHLNKADANPAWETDNTNWHLPVGIYLHSSWRHWTEVSPGSYDFDQYNIQSLGTQLVDVNNDGYPDIVGAWKPPAEADTTGVLIRFSDTFLNKGSNGEVGWDVDPQWNLPDIVATDLQKGAVLIDLNGDQLPDIFYTDGPNVSVYMNTGHGWVADSQSPWLVTGGDGDTRDASTQFADINSDGLVDMIVAKGDQASGSKILINSGDGWRVDDLWILPNADFRNYGTKLLDADADTRIDFMIHHNGSSPELYLNKGGFADALSTIDNGYGGVTTIQYKSSHAFNIIHTFLPFAMPVVDTVTRSNSIGQDYTQLYLYRNGVWSSEHREFWGFGIIGYSQHEGDYILQTYYQDEFRKGEVFHTQFTALNDTKLKTTTNFIGIRDVGVSGVKFVYPEFSQQNDFDAIGNLLKTSYKEFRYEDDQLQPQLGNLTKIIDYGEIEFINSVPTEILGDRRDVEIDYTKNITKHILGLPKNIRVKDEGGNTVRDSWHFYDDQNSDFNATPTHGLLSKIEEWNDSGDNPVTLMLYNNLGSIIKTQDPNTVATPDPNDYAALIEYDGQYGIFPFRTTNAQGHVVENKYFGIDGEGLSDLEGYAGLWGQLKSTKDPNNEITKFHYDVMGRLQRTVQPGDNFNLPSQEKLYTYGTHNILISDLNRIKSGNTETLDNHICLDGLGRKLFDKQATGNGAQIAITNHTQYDSKNKPIVVFNPYFDIEPLPLALPADATVKFSTTIYDGLGRLVRRINPDQSTCQDTLYDKWSVYSLDENGHRQDSHFDAYGRLIQKVQWQGEEGRNLNCPTTLDYNNNFTNPITTAYLYDTEGNLKQVTDTAGNATIINYNSLGRKTNMDDPDMGVWFYEYDLNGNLVKQTDAKNQVINFSYDNINRLNRKWDNALLDDNYFYDDSSKPNRIGRLSTVTFADGGKEFEYDVPSDGKLR